MIQKLKSYIRRLTNKKCRHCKNLYEIYNISYNEANSKYHIFHVDEKT